MINIKDGVRMEKFQPTLNVSLEQRRSCPAERDNVREAVNVGMIDFCFFYPIKDGVNAGKASCLHRICF